MPTFITKSIVSSYWTGYCLQMEINLKKSQIVLNINILWNKGEGDYDFSFLSFSWQTVGRVNGQFGGECPNMFVLLSKDKVNTVTPAWEQGCISTLSVKQRVLVVLTMEEHKWLLTQALIFKSAALK